MIKKRELRVKEIEKKISDVLECLEMIEKNFPNKEKDFFGLGIVKDGLYKRVESAIEDVITICNIINSDLRLGSPNSEDDILDNLKREKVFSAEIIELIRGMKGFRNILVHKYVGINDKKAYGDIKQGLGDFERIIEEIEGFLKKELRRKE